MLCYFFLSYVHYLMFIILCFLSYVHVYSNSKILLIFILFGEFKRSKAIRELECSFYYLNCLILINLFISLF